MENALILIVAPVEEREAIEVGLDLMTACPNGGMSYNFIHYVHPACAARNLVMGFALVVFSASNPCEEVVEAVKAIRGRSGRDDLPATYLDPKATRLASENGIATCPLEALGEKAHDLLGLRRRAVT